MNSGGDLFADDKKSDQSEEEDEALD